MTKRHWNIRGMGLDEVMAISAAALDETFEEMIDNAGKLRRAHGGTEEEIETVRDWQRQQLERDRNEQLAKLRAWFLRDCESLR
jgi:hypothetical protein